MVRNQSVLLFTVNMVILFKLTDWLPGSSLLHGLYHARQCEHATAPVSCSRVTIAIHFMQAFVSSGTVQY